MSCADLNVASADGRVEWCALGLAILSRELVTRPVGRVYNSGCIAESCHLRSLERLLVLLIFTLIA